MGRVKHYSSQLMKPSIKKKFERFSSSEAATYQEEKKSEEEVVTLLPNFSKIRQTF
jgi:glutaredoxin 2